MTASSNTATAAKQFSKRVKPPFRADHVGSLLRPKHMLEARDKLDKGEITTAELRRVEDEAIRHAQKVAELDPNDPFSFTQLSVIYQRCGKIQEAEDAMAKAHEMSGRHRP